MLSESIDPARFMEAWEINAQLNASPKVDFDFQSDGLVKMQIHSNPNAPWDSDNFHKAFTIALHRIASHCIVTWF